MTTILSTPTTVTVVEGSGSRIADWIARISGPNVVWYHNFDSASEVNQFRWTGEYSGGNDPLAKGVGGNLCAHVASGGADGGGFLRATYPAGSDPGRGNAYWWHPFTPLTGATNGRGQNDPGASGSIALQAWNVSDGSSTTISWGGAASNPGWYGSPTDQAANPSKYQGNDFYIQVRTRRAQTPGAPPDTQRYTSITGKHVWITTINGTYTNQELVTFGQSAGNGDVVGRQSLHNVYVGQNFTGLVGQPNATVAASNESIGWRYSGGWDTLLYHVTPGTRGGTGANRSRVEVWAQHDPALFPSEAGQYKKIWDVTYTQGFDSGTNTVNSPNLPGWSGLILGIYHNGSVFSSSFSFDYDQVIFSKSPIPAPTV
jgi:hypothetical protein